MRDKTPISNPSPAEKKDSSPKTASAWEQLTARYLDDLPHQLDSIIEILDVKDYGGVKAQAHRIKGTSGTYKLESISQGAAQLESAAESRNPQSVSRAVQNVRRLAEMESTRISLKSVTGKTDPERTANG
jgi:HPt (histidine-containing phosphotransfer) domain-containing protein